MIPVVETLTRIDRFIRERLETSVILEEKELTLSAWSVPDEPVPFKSAIKNNFATVLPGAKWGRAWSTMWLHVEGDIPLEWVNLPEGLELEVIADLGFSRAHPGFQAEGIVYTRNGSLVKGLHPYNQHIAVTEALLKGDGTQSFDFYIECAANPNALENNGFGGDGFFSPISLGSKETRPDQDLYTLGTIRVGVRDIEIWRLLQEAQILYQYLLESDEQKSKYSQVLHALDTMCDVVDPHNVSGTAQAGRSILAQPLALTNSATAHLGYAIGHAHIDSAWMWPVRETIRKCARTFSNQLELMEKYPEHIFIASSAQQFKWLEKHYPELFSRIEEKVAKGKFLPIGSMWVESDTNMPGPEALARQFIYGARYFAQKFKIRSKIVWLPDSFGYSGALPQIARLTGHTGFFSQKLSWNDTNKMPHKSFNWHGIDGSSLTAHFPPVSTYNANFSVRELRRTENDHSEKHLHNASIIPFGYGNGGGGPTREHLERAKLLEDLEDLPRIQIRDPQDFYDSLEEIQDKLPHWIGEMYLEFHRGIFTSQPGMKQGNRRSERLLKEAELWCSLAEIIAGHPYPYEVLEEIWEDVLLYQFHDILPGTSIAWVHREAEVRYAKIQEELESMISGALRALAGSGDKNLLVHSTPAVLGKNAGYSISSPKFPAAEDATHSRYMDDEFTIQTDTLKITFNNSGYISSLVTRTNGEEHVPAGEQLGLLQLHRDTPKAWDAWDLDVQYRRVFTNLDVAQSIQLTESAQGFTIAVEREFDESSLTQIYSVNPGSTSIDIKLDVNWQQKQQLLKLRLPTTVFSDRYRAETQFGHIWRTTHSNTSWDFARFESCAGRWIHLADQGRGVAIANDSSYGQEVALNLASKNGESPYAIARVSILRAPLYPDPKGDSGQYSFNFSYTVEADLDTAIHEGYRMNHPIRTLQGERGIDFPISIVKGHAIIETVKLAEDRSGDLIVRLFEPWGTKQKIRLRTDLQFESVKRVDLLEEALETSTMVVDSKALDDKLNPFEIVTLRFKKPSITTREGS